MSEADFRLKRRQPFLTEKYFQLNRAFCEDEIVQNQTAIDEGRFQPRELPFPGMRGSSFKNALKVLRLHYTAGEPIESLRPLYVEAMHWFEEWHRAYREYIAELGRERNEELRDDGSPCPFEDLFHYQLALDVVSLGVLLGELDHVRRSSKWLGRYRHTDMLFEAIVERVVSDPSETEEFFHETPYGPLLDAIFTANTPEEAAAFVKTYLEGWYKSFEGVPWHDGHMQVTDEYSNYEGYWAFEAAAVCVLYGIDDSTFRDHIVYPKDLADWARAHGVLNRIKPNASGSDGAIASRCPAGQPCPREGWWFTPATQGSRRHFHQGEVMPDFKSDYGATIWQWDAVQGE